MTILLVGTGPRWDPPRLERGCGVIFRDGDGDEDEDKILSARVSGAGMGKHSPPRPRYIYIYNLYMYIILLNFLNFFFELSKISQE